MSLAMPVAATPIPNVAPFFRADACGNIAADRAQVAGPVNCERPIGAWTINAGSHADASANDRCASVPPSPPPTATDSSMPGTDFSVRSNGNLHDQAVSDNDRHTAVAIHLSPLAFIWIGPFALAIPLVIWLMRKDHSRFAADHGKETVNFLMSFVVLHLLLAVTLIGIIMWPVLWVVSAINVVRGSMAASRGEYFRYPVTIRFL